MVDLQKVTITAHSEDLMKTLAELHGLLERLPRLINNARLVELGWLVQFDSGVGNDTIIVGLKPSDRLRNLVRALSDVEESMLFAKKVLATRAAPLEGGGEE